MVLPPANSAVSEASASRPGSNPEKDSGKDCIGNRSNSGAGTRIGRNHRPSLANPNGVGMHLLKIDANIGSEIDLIDDEQVASQKAWPSLPRDVITTGNINHEYPPVDEIKRKGRGEIVAARFEQDQLDAGEFGFKIVACSYVERRILPDDGMRASTGFDC